jgi:hypothetical protein
MNESSFTSYYQLPPLPVLPITSAETLAKCKSLSPSHPSLDTIFIASFPKSGTTWMQNIVVQMLLLRQQQNSRQQKINNDTKDGLPFTHISQYAPFYDIDAHWTTTTTQDDQAPNTLLPQFQEAHTALGARVFNTHLRWDMLPTKNNTGKTTKCIYVVRDGRDVVTSFYHHLSNQHAEDGGFVGTFDEFFDQFLEGTVAYGKWSHHLASWMPEIVKQQEQEQEQANHTRNQEILLVKYEDLKSDLKGQLRRIADFLALSKDSKAETQNEQEYEQSRFLDQVMERVSFEYMRKHQSLFHPISVRWKPGYHFIRSGTVGDYKSLFTKDHESRFRAAVHSEFEILEQQRHHKTDNKKSAGSGGGVPSWLDQVLVGFGDES